MVEEVALLSASRHSAHSTAFKFFTENWLLFGVAAAAEGGCQVTIIDEQDITSGALHGSNCRPKH